MPAKEFSLKLKPKVNIHKFIKSLDKELIAKGNLDGVSKGDIVCISARGTFFWDGQTLIQDNSSGSKCSSTPQVPSIFLTFDPFPLGYWKSPGMNVSWTRFKFVKIVPSFNLYQQKTYNRYEYKLKDDKNKTHKVISDVEIYYKTPVIIIERATTPGYDFESYSWTN